MVFLLPAAALGLAARAGDAGDARDALGTGLLLVPLLGSGPWASAVAACLWLTALPAARCVDRHAVAATVPWTLGAAGALLLTSPWGGVAAPAPTPAWLTAGWAVALVATFLPWRVARVAWLLPALALAWTVPVEGADRRVAAGEELRLPAPPGAGWAFQVRCEDPATAGAPVLVTVAGDMGPLRAGRDAPLAGAPARHPLLTSGGRGRHARSRASGVSSRRTTGPVTLRAATRVTVRWEPLERWRRRRRRFVGLVGGALLLLTIGLWASSGRHRMTDAGLTVGLAAAVAAGSGVAVIARPAFRGAADLAAVVFLAALAALWPAVRRRRLAAGLLFLAPLALAQPLLRHPAGDEVYHLELAESLVHDGDLDITNNIDAAVPSEAVYLREGSRLIHSPALALLALPGFVLLGQGGALLLTAFLVAAAAALAARRARELGVSARAVNWAWALTLASCPAITFATQLWPAAAGMAAAAALLWAAARPAPLSRISHTLPTAAADAPAGTVFLAAAQPATCLKHDSAPPRPKHRADRRLRALATEVCEKCGLWAVATTVASMLVKVRLGLITVPIALAAAFRRRRPVWAAAVLGAGVAAAAVIAAILGGPLGRHRLVELLPASPAAMLTAAWGLLWDPAGGLAFAAPLWLVALAGLAAVWRKGGPGERALLLGGALTVALLLPRGEWYGGGSPPGRYLAPLAPLVLLGLAFLAGKRRGRRLIRLAVPWAAVASWVALTRPLWWFNPVDGGWWLADRISRGLGVAARRLFPSLLRPSPAVLLVPLFLLGLAWWWRRRPRAGAVAVSLVLFAGSVGLAAGAPEARVDAEDPQVRHLGGGAEPPPGAFFRAARGISWRLGPGDAVELPWNPPQGEQPVARVRVLKGERGVLLARWRNGPAATRVAVRGKRWRRVRLPYADGFGRSVLRLEWSGGSGSAVLIDRVETGR